MASFRLKSPAAGTGHDSDTCAPAAGWSSPACALAFAVASVLSLVVAPTAGAQFTVFGKNKVQYMDFEWHVIHSDHFDVYFYPEEEELARRTRRWAEESYDVLSEYFGHEVTRRVPLILYNSHQAFAQTNVTPFFLPEGVAGLTEFIKGRVLMPFNGSYNQFRNTLHHELVHVFQLSIVTSVHRRYFRQSIAPVPFWLTEGLADYLSEEWNGIGEMVLSDMVVDGRLPSIQELWRFAGTFTAYKLGQRLCAYLVEAYGEDVIPRLYENLWAGPEFANVLLWVTGDSIDEISARWHQHEREHYYPTVLEREPIALSATALTKRGADFKPIEVPAEFLGDGDDDETFLFVSPRTGYTNIYAASLNGNERNVRTIVRGERSAQFESLHPFLSKIDVSPTGHLAFVSKWHDTDALLIFDLKRRELVGRYRFSRILSMSSPSWDPEGRRVVFQGLSDDAYSDLYLFEPETEVLTRLTNDLYQDLDPDFTPDGERVVFASDRTEFGEGGARNLFELDLSDLELRYLTRGQWVDSAPRVSADGERVYFASTRDGIPDLYEIDFEGNGRRLTRYLTGALDPSPTADGKHLLFTGFANGRYNAYKTEIPSGFEAEFALGPPSGRPGWWWPDPTEHGKAEAARYTRTFGLDFAAGGVAFDPGQTDSQGAQFVFTDMLGDELISAQVGNTAQRGDNFLERMNVGVSYLNLRRRVNYGIGLFHFAGDFIDERDFAFFERRAGVSLIASYPFSKFRRVETSVGFAYSDKRNPSTGVDRRAYLATNFVSWVHDNSLWIPTGPVDGTRVKATFGFTLDLPRAELENVQLLADYRRYFRAGLRSALATRVQARWSFGSDPRFWTLGGSHTLRGYPRRQLFGTRSILVNNEYRFPLVNGFIIGFPFGAVEFPGIEGAFFGDAAWLWDEGQDAPWPPLGSLGVSFRMSFGGFLVFRLDLARRTDFESIEKTTRSEFFIGWDY